MDNIIMRSVHHLLLPDWYKIATSASNMQNIVFGKWYTIGIAGVLKKTAISIGLVRFDSFIFTIKYWN